MTPPPSLFSLLQSGRSILRSIGAALNIPTMTFANTDVGKTVKSANNSSHPRSEPYYFDSGLRRVHPYWYTYNTFCKERWRNRELLDIFVTEFRDRTPEYYVRHSFDWDSAT